MTLQDYGIGGFELTCAVIGITGFILTGIYEICSHFEIRAMRTNLVCLKCEWYSRDGKWCFVCKKRH